MCIFLIFSIDDVTDLLTRRPSRAAAAAAGQRYALAEAGRRNAEVLRAMGMTPRTGDLLAHLVLSHKVQPTPWTHAVVREELDGLAGEYIAALMRAAPHLGRAEVTWRYHLMVGAILMAVADSGPDNRISRLSAGACDPSDREALRAELAGFLASAFETPTAEVLAGRSAGGEGGGGRGADKTQDQDENVDREESSCPATRGPAPP